MRLFIFLILLAFTFFGFYKERDFFRVTEVDLALFQSSEKHDLVNKILPFINAKLASNSEKAQANTKLDLYWKKQLSGVKNQLSFVKNEFIWNTPLNKISEIVSQFPWIQSYKIIRDWPNKVVVKIAVREPHLLYVNSEGFIQPVDAEGILLPMIGFNEAPSLPFLRGSYFQNQNSLRKKAVEVLNLLPADGNFTKEKISDISYQETDGFIVTLIWKSMKVKVGYEPSTLVGLRVNQVLDYLQNRNIDGRVIDANFSKKVLVKLQNHP